MNVLFLIIIEMDQLNEKTLKQMRLMIKDILNHDRLVVQKTEKEKEKQKKEKQKEKEKELFYKNLENIKKDFYENFNDVNYNKFESIDTDFMCNNSKMLMELLPKYIEKIEKRRKAIWDLMHLEL